MVLHLRTTDGTEGTDEHGYCFKGVSPNHHPCSSVKSVPSVVSSNTLGLTDASDYNAFAAATSTRLS